MSLIQALSKALAQGGADGVDLVLKAPLDEVNALALVVVTPPPKPRDLFEAHDPEFQEHPLRVQLRELPAPLRESIRAAANRRIAEATPRSESSLPVLREQLALREKARNALAGLSGPPIDLASLKKEALETVADAKAARLAEHLDPAAIEAFRQSFVGLNEGPDRIVSVAVDPYQTFFRLRAVDESGYRVLEAQVSLQRWPPPSLYLDMVRATHGRNANELELLEGDRAVIGRGNPQAVATFFLGAIRLARSAGVSNLTLRAGGPSVARLYQRMGFEIVRGMDMKLDLTDLKKVETFLLGFYPARWQQGLEKVDVSAQRAAAGDWLTLPARG